MRLYGPEVPEGRLGGTPALRRPMSPGACAYLILVSRNSTCFFATGSYFFFTIFSVWVREVFLVT